MRTNLNFLISLIFFSLSSILFAQDDNGIFQYGEFKENSKVNLFADKVNIREKPSVKSKVVANLPITTEVKIISKSEEKETINGYTTNWYKISFNNNGNKCFGYVWGGFLSTVTLNTVEDSGIKVIFLYAISGYTDDKGFVSTLKAVIDGKIVSSITISPEATEQNNGNYGYNINGKLIGCKGLDKVKEVIMLTYLYPACGFSNGDKIIFWNGKDLIYGTENPRVSEAGVFSYSCELIYPDDEGSSPNTIIRKEETIAYDEKGNIEKTTIKRVTYIWDTKKLISQNKE